MRSKSSCDLLTKWRSPIAISIVKNDHDRDRRSKDRRSLMPWHKANILFSSKSKSSSFETFKHRTTLNSIHYQIQNNCERHLFLQIWEEKRKKNCKMMIEEDKHIYKKNLLVEYSRKFCSTIWHNCQISRVSGNLHEKDVLLAATTTTAIFLPQGFYYESIPFLDDYQMMTTIANRRYNLLKLYTV